MSTSKTRPTTATVSRCAIRLVRAIPEHRLEVGAVLPTVAGPRRGGRHVKWWVCSPHDGGRIGIMPYEAEEVK